MSLRSNALIPCAVALATAVVLLACGGSDDDSPATAQPVTITSTGANAVSTWNEIAATTINVPAAAGGTAEEARPNYAVDLATVHVAIYDAVMAIARTHQSYAITPSAPSDGASSAPRPTRWAGSTPSSGRS